jgi:hypothetical protein
MSEPHSESVKPAELVDISYKCIKPVEQDTEIQDNGLKKQLEFEDIFVSIDYPLHQLGQMNVVKKDTSKKSGPGLGNPPQYIEPINNVDSDIYVEPKLHQKSFNLIDSGKNLYRQISHISFHKADVNVRENINNTDVKTSSDSNKKEKEKDTEKKGFLHFGDKKKKNKEEKLKLKRAH